MSANRFPSISGYFGPFVLVGALIFGLLLFGAFLLAMQILRPQSQPEAVGTGMLYVIQVSTSTPVPPPAEPTLAPSPIPQDGGSGIPVEIGAYVQVSGTGIDGLRVRTSPSLASEVRFVAIEAEVFEVIDGPQTQDGYDWWYLQAPYYETVHGWAVAEYLDVIQRSP